MKKKSARHLPLNKYRMQQRLNFGKKIAAYQNAVLMKNKIHIRRKRKEMKEKKKLL